LISFRVKAIWILRNNRNRINQLFPSPTPFDETEEESAEPKMDKKKTKSKKKKKETTLKKDQKKTTSKKDQKKTTLKKEQEIATAPRKEKTGKMKITAVKEETISKKRKHFKDDLVNLAEDEEDKEKKDEELAMFGDSILTEGKESKQLIVNDNNQEQLIQAARNADKGKLICATKRMRVFGKDIARLNPKIWLNDEIINSYIELLMKRSNKTYLIFNTFFYPQLEQNGYSKVESWKKEINIFDLTHLLIPIHSSSHWTLVDCDMKNKKIYYYDSYLQPTEKNQK